MKYHTTKKEVQAGYDSVIRVGYCNLQCLLKYETPVAYTTRQEGWAADVYEVGPGTAIVTGYAPFGNIDPGYDLCREYDMLAQCISDRDTLTEMIWKFVDEAVAEEELSEPEL